MKIILPQIDYVFDCCGDRCSSLIIENQNAFYNIVADICNQIAGEEGQSVLSEDNKTLSIAKYGELISQFVPFDINQKNLLTKITTQMQHIAVDESHYMRTNELMGMLERYFMELSVEMVGNLDFQKVTADAMIKASGVHIDDIYDNLGEKLLDYFELVQEYDERKLFVLVNVRSYISDAEMKLFLESVLAREVQILMLEGSEHSLLEKEKRHIVDADMCVIC